MMGEFLFVVATIFVTYVLVEMFDKKPVEPARPINLAPKPAQTPPPQPAVKPSSTSSAMQTAPKPKAEPAAKPVASPPKPKSPQPEPTLSSSAALATLLKNPATGEVAKIPNSYAFAKRWIKEALVAEGFLDKIYKNNELNGSALDDIQAAFTQLRAMDKYRGD